MTDVSVTVGDVLHFQDPLPQPLTPDVPILQPTVADLLASARAAHARFQLAAGAIDRAGTVVSQPDDSAAAHAILEALNARSAAESADPLHHDRAWALDAAANNGIRSADLLAFYRDYLQP